MGKWEELLMQGSSERNEKAQSGGRWSALLSQQPEEQAYDFSPKNMIRNIPGSAKQFGTDIYNVFRHPQQTKNALTGLAAGLIEKAVPGEQQHEKYANAAIDFYKERYGGIENFKKTVEKDPVGVLSDFASLLSVGGGGLKLSGASKAGSALTKASEFVEPVNIITKSAKIPFKIIPNNIPEGIYARAAQMSTTLPAKERISAVKTALEEKIPLTRGGIDKLWGKVFALDKKVDDILSYNPTTTVSREAILSNIEEAYDYFADYPGNKLQMKKIEKVEKEVRDQFPTQIPVEEAQAIKKKVYKVLKDAYKGEIKIPDKKARVAIASGIRQEIGKLFPETLLIGEKEGSLIALNNAIEKSVERISQQKLISWRDWIVGGTVGSATQSVGAGITAFGVFSVLSDPKVQSRLAILMNDTRKISKTASEAIKKASPFERRLLLNQMGAISRRYKEFGNKEE